MHSPWLAICDITTTESNLNFNQIRSKPRSDESALLFVTPVHIRYYDNCHTLVCLHVDLMKLFYLFISSDDIYYFESGLCNADIFGRPTEAKCHNMDISTTSIKYEPVMKHVLEFEMSGI